MAGATISLRWNGQQLPAILGDMRAEPVLEQLNVDVQARATEPTDTAERGRLIQATPTFRAIVAACGRMRGEPTPVG